MSKSNATLAATAAPTSTPTPIDTNNQQQQHRDNNKDHKIIHVPGNQATQIHIQSQQAASTTLILNNSPPQLRDSNINNSNNSIVDLQLSSDDNHNNERQLQQQQQQQQNNLIGKQPNKIQADESGLNLLQSATVSKQSIDRSQRLSDSDQYHQTRKTTILHDSSITELNDFKNHQPIISRPIGNLVALNEDEEFRECGEEEGDEEEDDINELDDANDSDRLITNTDETTTSTSKYRGNSKSSSLDSRRQFNDSGLFRKTSSKQSNNLRRNRKFPIAGRTFRGSYRYSRVQITMAILKKFASLMVQKSTLALFGAFLIHVTLGTIYTLSNINSYLTSYMRLHGSPNATYGGSMWISSSYAVGQGFSMVLGGYIEKRFSARLACILGCLLHSSSTILTSYSINYGYLAVLATYGFIPGFGCGLAYMTPMSNGFGWFPNRKGLVAGVILAGFGIGTFVFNMAQTAYVNPDNLSPPDDGNGYFTQQSILERVPHLFVFIGSIYAVMQFIGCCLLFKPPYLSSSGTRFSSKGTSVSEDERPILLDNEIDMKHAIRTREFVVLFLVYGITTQGVLFVNSMLKEYGQLFIDSDMYLAWTGSMASIANSVGRLAWGLAIDRFTFTQCFTAITIIFASLMFLMPFEFILSSKLLYLLCTLGLFGSFSGWMSTYPVHLSRVFGRTNSGMIYGLIFVSQSCGGIITALGAHYLIDHFNRFVPFFCVVLLEVLGLSIYHLFYPK